MNLSLRQLKAFLQVARLRSFTRAAEQLHMTQAGLSSLIQDLEGQLDSRLFDRTTRAVTLTAAGLQFHPAAEQSVVLLEGVAETIGRMEDSARQTLSVGTTPVIASSLMPEACREFAKRHPNVTVRVHDVERSQLQALVEAGQIDVGFGVFFKPTAGLERQPIFLCDLVCIAPADMELGERMTSAASKPLPKVPWSMLQKLPLLGLPTDNPIQQLIDSRLAHIGRANEPRPTFAHFQTILEMVEAGFGAAILPSFAMAAARRLKVRAATLSDPVVPINYYQINLKGKARAESEAAFVSCLLRTMRRRCAPSHSTIEERATSP